MTENYEKTADLIFVSMYVDYCLEKYFDDLIKFVVFLSLLLKPKFVVKMFKRKAFAKNC